MKWTGNWSVRLRLRLASAAFLAAIAFLAYDLASSDLARIDDSEKEIAGMRYIGEIRKVSVAQISGKVVDNAADILKAAEADGARYFDASDASKQVYQQLGRTPVDQRALRIAIANLIDQVTDTSGLALDPDLPTYYTQDLRTAQIRRLIVAVGQLGGFALAGQAPGGAATVDQVLSEIKLVLAAIDTDFKKASTGDSTGTVARLLGEPVKNLRPTLDGGLSMLRALATGQPVGEAAPLLEPIIAALVQTAQQTEASFLLLADKRVTDLRRHMWQHLAVAGAAILIGLYLLVFAVEIGAMAPLGRITRAIRQLADGDITVPAIPVTSTNEIGQLAAALEQLRGTVIDAFAKGQMIDRMPVSVMVADPVSGTISYANDAMQGFVTRIEAHLPVKAGDLVGSDVDRFHKSPGHVRAIIGDPARLPWASKLQIGAESVDMLVTAIRDAGGRYSATMLTWIETTAKVKLASEFEATIALTVDEVVGTAHQVRDTADILSQTAGDTRMRAQTVAAAAEQATANVQTVAAAAEELSASIGEISRQIASATAIATQAVTSAQSTNQTVDGLSQSAARIGDVVKLIADIASQTNLLALNATIEAARAGDAGKGFAVVAAEVKNLASQTAQATEDITRQIEEIQGATNSSVTAIREIGGTIERISGITAGIAAAVEQQSAATREIARNVQEAATGTQEVSSNIVDLNASAERTGAAATELHGSAETLVERGQSIRSRMDNFIVGMRAI